MEFQLISYRISKLHHQSNYMFCCGGWCSKVTIVASNILSFSHDCGLPQHNLNFIVYRVKYLIKYYSCKQRKVRVMIRQSKGDINILTFFLCTSSNKTKKKGLYELYLSFILCSGHERVNENSLISKGHIYKKLL